MPRPDFEEIAQRHPLREQLRCDGVKIESGGSFICPFHNDTKPSAFLIKGGIMAQCQADHCRRVFDSIDYVARTKGVDRSKAIEILDGYQPMKPQPKPADQEPEFHLTFIPETKIPKAGTRFSWLKQKGQGRVQVALEAVYVYRDEEGVAQQLVCRMKRQDGGKDIRQVSWCGAREDFVGMQRKRLPLYGAQGLARHPDRRVLVVEGEKCVDWLQPVLEPHYVVVTWCGGADQAGKRDFSLLADRDVTWWPDADAIKEGESEGKGERAMRAAMALARARTNRWIEPIDTWRDAKSGYDAADLLEGHGYDASVVREALEDLPQVIQPPAQEVEIQGPTSRDYDWLPAGQRPITNKSAQVKATSPANHVLFLRYHPDFRGRFTYDVFDRKVLIDGEPMRDVLVMDALVQLSSLPEKLEAGLRSVGEIIVGIAMDNRVNRLADHLRELAKTWDGRSRFVLDMAGVEPTEWTQLVSRRWGIGLARRILEPGCQHDGVLVIEGPQGVGKSTFIQILGQSIPGRDLLTTLHTLRLDSNNAMQLCGKAIAELTEMTALRKSQQDEFKAMISSTTDNYRRPYARDFEDVPRTCVFAGTTNRDQDYLSDPTGNRRIWPVRMARQYDRDALRAELPQIWAEWAARALEGETSTMSDRERDLQVSEAAEREVEHPWVETLRFSLQDRSQVPARDILNIHLSVAHDRQTQNMKTLVGEVMKQLGWVKRTVRIEGYPTKCWVRP